MRILSHEKIPPRVLIKKITEKTKSKRGSIELRADAEELPRAEVIMVPDQIKDIVSPGDKVYYIENKRGRSKVIFKGQEHWMVDVGSIVAIYEEANGKD